MTQANLFRLALLAFTLGLILGCLMVTYAR
jgi:hypothetical protein